MALTIGIAVYTACLSDPTTQILTLNDGKIIITFDDNWACQSVRDHALPLMNQYGMKGITFFPTNHIEWKTKREWFKPLIQEFIDNGWEIGSHTHRHPHLNSVSRLKLLEEIKHPKQLLESEFSRVNNGLGILTFAYPFGEGWDNETVDTLVRETYMYARPCGSWMKHPPDNPGCLGSTFSTSWDDTCIQKTQDALDFAAKHKTWGWLLFHGVSDDPQGEYGASNPRFVSIKNFTLCLKLIRDSELPVTTMVSTTARKACTPISSDVTVWSNQYVTSPSTVPNAPSCVQHKLLHLPKLLLNVDLTTHQPFFFCLAQSIIYLRENCIIRASFEFFLIFQMRTEYA